MRAPMIRARLAVIAAVGAVMLPLGVMPGASAATAPTAGWVLGYGFESLAGGVVRDASPSGITGQLRGTPLPLTAASVSGHGQAIMLWSGNKHFVDVPDVAALDVNTYTLTAWVRYTANVHDDRWEVLEKADAYWMNIRTDTRKLRVGGFYGSCTSAGWRYLDSATKLAPKTWIHVASTYDGTTLRLYINGVLNASRAVSGRTCSNSQPLAIGAKNYTKTGVIEAYFDGRIDDVRIYSRALTAAQIVAVKAALTG